MSIIEKAFHYEENEISVINPIQYGLFLKHYGMGGTIMPPPPCNFAGS